MRDINQCHPKLRTLANKLVKKCEKSGLKIRITECLRTTAEQDALYAQGRTKPGNIVTRARGSSFSSMHQWGVAFDFCRNDGRGAFDDSDGFFSKVGAIGVSIGLEWGGNWKSIIDKPHFQLPDWGSTTTVLRNTYGSPDRFFATWGDGTKVSVPTTSSSGEEYNMPTIKKGSKGKAVKIWQIVIGVEPDGSFGQSTHKKTLAFQKKHGLVEDGIVGRKTWKAGLESV